VTAAATVALCCRAAWMELIRLTIPKYLATPPPLDHMVLSDRRVVLGRWHQVVVDEETFVSLPSGARPASI
jgi:hypothetical protein